MTRTSLLWLSTRARSTTSAVAARPIAQEASSATQTVAGSRGTSTGGIVVQAPTESSRTTTGISGGRVMAGLRYGVRGSLRWPACS